MPSSKNNILLLVVFEGKPGTNVVDKPVPKYGFFKKSLDPLNTACVMVK